MKKYHFLLIVFQLVLFAFNSHSQNKTIAKVEYRAEIHRSDKLPIVFNISETRNAGKITWTIKNADEKMVSDRIVERGDSLLVYLPFFDGLLLLKKSPNGLEGVWVKKTIKGDQFMPISIKKGTKRLMLNGSVNKFNVTGRWNVEFVNNKKIIAKCL